MAAATAAQIKTALADLLKVAEASMASHFTGITTRAATFAEQEARGRLYARGFTVANVDDWDRLFELTLEIGLWRSIVQGGLYGGFDPTVLASLDRREELKSILVTVNGIWIEPASGQAGTTTTSGPLRNDGSSVFDYDASDSDLGIPW